MFHWCLTWEEKDFHIENILSVADINLPMWTLGSYQIVGSSELIMVLELPNDRGDAHPGKSWHKGVDLRLSSCCSDALFKGKFRSS